MILVKLKRLNLTLLSMFLFLSPFLIGTYALAAAKGQVYSLASISDRYDPVNRENIVTGRAQSWERLASAHHVNSIYAIVRIYRDGVHRASQGKWENNDTYAEIEREVRDSGPRVKWEVHSIAEAYYDDGSYSSDSDFISKYIGPIDALELSDYGGFQ